MDQQAAVEMITLGVVVGGLTARRIDLAKAKDNVANHEKFIQRLEKDKINALARACNAGLDADTYRLFEQTIDNEMAKD